MTVSAFAAFIGTFGASVTNKSVSGEGEPEEQLRTPTETLLKAIGEHLGIGEVLCVGEARLAGVGAQPDYAIYVGESLVGHVELKAPGKGAVPAPSPAPTRPPKPPPQPRRRRQTLRPESNKRPCRAPPPLRPTPTLSVPAMTLQA